MSFLSPTIKSDTAAGIFEYPLLIKYLIPLPQRVWLAGSQLRLAEPIVEREAVGQLADLASDAGE